MGSAPERDRLRAYAVSPVLYLSSGPASTTATVYCFTRAGAGSGDCDDLTLIRQPS
ncbi:hypothetical protein [Kribbella sp. NPDC050459]|uniref:hypothetical protein n=1 Tax=Kribbella sp. NPDC050459 TaxID=3155785 RepID=UPI0033C47F60